MKVIKEAKIKISSVIENLDAAGLAEGDAERAESCASGFYHYADGEVILTYTENGEGKDVSSEISYRSGIVTVCRRGAIESELRFEEGARHTSLYSIPPYTFNAEVRAKRIRSELSESGGVIDLHYNMKIGGAEKSARMKIWISTS